MYSWYQMKYYFREGDPDCAKCDEAIKRLEALSCEGGCNTKFNGFHRVDMDAEPPVEEGCEFTKVPTFVYHGKKLYEAKGGETVEDWLSILNTVTSLTGPSHSEL